MRIIAVIGKNFGDEGKGLVTSSLSLSYPKTLIVKSNGGAQAGHTVENVAAGTRIVHHQTGSGCEYGADTLWAATYHPDLFKLEDEVNEVDAAVHAVPRIFAEPNAAVTTIDDVLINMALESMRGDERHGSCGMGINECCLRGDAGYALTIGDIQALSERELTDRLTAIRREYTTKRIREAGLPAGGEYMALLQNEDVLANFASVVKANMRFVTLTEADPAFLAAYDAVIFENGQGLLLDADNARFAPHVTASSTGLALPMQFLHRRGLRPDEVIYVTRPYVTRHGAGFLPCECGRASLRGVLPDATNITNEWQGTIRYATHESIEEFMAPVDADMQRAGLAIKPSLALTHMDETAGKIFFEEKTLNFDEFEKIFAEKYAKIYLSENRETLKLL